MNSRIQSIIVGSILGDGYMTELTVKKKSRLWLKYDDRYLSYLEWLHEELRPIGVGIIKGKKGYHQHQFLTDSSSEIGKLKMLFYPKGKKLVPKNIDQLLIDPSSLAVWYMDDGTLDQRERYHFNALFATHGFSFEDCVRLAKVLNINFKIQTSVCRCLMRGKLRYRLYLWSRSMDHFMDLIEPYILPCFAHKIRKSRQQQR